MERHRAPTPPRRRRVALAGVAAVLAVVAVVATVAALHDTPPRVPVRAAVPVPVTGTAGPASTGPVSTDVLTPLPPTPGPVRVRVAALPVSVSIPSLGVSSTLEPLGLLADGSLTPPSSYGRAGWYAGGTRPGDTGPALVVGHVDSYRGPGVFFRLREIVPGARVTVARADGSTVAFVVDSVEQFPKTGFPSAVFDPTPTPELVLVTCTGSFDRSARSYRDNLVVTAVPA